MRQYLDAVSTISEIFVVALHFARRRQCVDLPPLCCVSRYCFDLKKGVRDPKFTSRKSTKAPLLDDKYSIATDTTSLQSARLRRIPCIDRNLNRRAPSRLLLVFVYLFGFKSCTHTCIGRATMHRRRPEPDKPRRRRQEQEIKSRWSGRKRSRHLTSYCRSGR